MPGDPEPETGARRLCEGIPVDKTTLQKLREAVGEAGFCFPRGGLLLSSLTPWVRLLKRRFGPARLERGMG